MKFILQRVAEASVQVSDRIIASIGSGLLLYVGLGEEDTESVCKAAIEKIIHLRVFADESGKFQHSLLDVKADVLLISQFTLLADTSKGRRPDFFSAMRPSEARELFATFVSLFQLRYPHRVVCGEFGAHMQVSSVNDGPVTIPLELS